MPFHETRRAPSTEEGTKQLVDLVVQQMEVHKWVENDAFGVHLAVEEAVVNAKRHGNCNDKSKRITMRATITRDSVFIVVSDEGVGFSMADVPDPTAETNLEKPSGRGLMLMRSFMDTVTFNDKGNEVTMTKICGGESAENVQD